MKLQPHQHNFTLDIAKLIIKANSMGVELTFGEAYRTIDQQLLYYHGMTINLANKQLKLEPANKKSHVMVSNHMKRLAIDFNFFINGILTYTDPKIEELGRYWESLNPKNRWGGNFKGFYDSPHFERNIKL